MKRVVEYAYYNNTATQQYVGNMFRQSKRRTAGRKNFETTNTSFESSKFYSTRLSLYDIPPLEEVTLEEFETWAIERLKVLIEIESCVARQKSMKDITDTIKPILLKYLPLSPGPRDNGAILQERRKDHYSHFILRLVFCRTEDLRKKFVKNETILFKVRYNMMQPKEQKEFINAYNDKLPWNYISSEEKLSMFDDLFAATSGTIRNTLLLALEQGVVITNEQVLQHIKSREEFIKLPFEKVLSLVGSRSILLKDGFGYIPTSSQLNLLADEFQDLLSKMLLKTFQSIPRLEEDDRILPLLNNLSLNFSSIEYDLNSYDSEAKSDINATSITQQPILHHYPLCGKHLQRNMILNSHLKYTGRTQLTLFLKGIGLSADEAVKFWATLFTSGRNAMSLDKFNKEYRYNVRHAYGLEGGRINAKPWTCSTILSRPRPNKTEFHGCPYRDLSMDSLVQNLNEMGINDQQEVNGVLDHVTKTEYTTACTRVFEITHKKQLANSKSNAEGFHISHPNLYFDRLRQLERAEAKA